MVSRSLRFKYFCQNYIEGGGKKKKKMRIQWIWCGLGNEKLGTGWHRKYLQYKGLGFSCSCLWLCSFHDLSLLVERGKHLLSFSSLGIGEQYYAGEH